MFFSNKYTKVALLCVLSLSFLAEKCLSQEPKELNSRIVSSFPSPGPSPQGLAWDSENLWVADDSTKMIYKVNPVTGAVEYSFNSPGSEPRGLTFDSINLWCLDDSSRKIFKLNQETGSIISSLNFPAEVNYMSTEALPFYGLAWDGKFLYTDFEAGWSSSVVKINPENGNVDTTFYCDAKDLTFDGMFLWNVDSRDGYLKGFLHKHELPSGQVVASFTIPGYYPTGLTFDGTCFWLADDHADSLYQMQTSTTDIKVFQNIPQHFKLHQNYPNPFNATTIIRYSIDKPSYVLITIYDITGKEVRTLTNQNHMPGVYRVKWNGKDQKGGEVSSGIYIYQLCAGSFVKSKKAIFVK